MRILRLTSYFEPEQMSSSHLEHDRFECYAENGIYTSVITPWPTRGISKEVREKARKHEILYGGFTKSGVSECFKRVEILSSVPCDIVFVG